MGEVRLAPWGGEDEALLVELNGDPEQMAHVGGAESPERIAERQARYLEDPGQFVVVDPEGRRAGWVGFWTREWRGREVAEIGWSIRRGFQGRGLATAGTRLAVDAAAAAGVREVHAFSGVDNVASNRVCERVGFTLVEAGLAFEYPPGHVMTCNDWVVVP